MLVFYHHHWSWSDRGDAGGDGRLKKECHGLQGLQVPALPIQSTAAPAGAGGRNVPEVV